MSWERCDPHPDPNLNGLGMDYVSHCCLNQLNYFKHDTNGKAFKSLHTKHIQAILGLLGATDHQVGVQQVLATPHTVSQLALIIDLNSIFAAL